MIIHVIRFLSRLGSSRITFGTAKLQAHCKDDELFGCDAVHRVHWLLEMDTNRIPMFIFYWALQEIRLHGCTAANEGSFTMQHHCDIDFPCNIIVTLPALPQREPNSLDTCHSQAVTGILFGPDVFPVWNLGATLAATSAWLFEPSPLSCWFLKPLPAGPVFEEKTSETWRNSKRFDHELG